MQSQDHELPRSDVREVLEQARYGVSRLRSVRDRNHVSFYLIGTVVLLRSVPWILLEEYNKLFSLGIPLNTRGFGTGEFRKLNAQNPSPVIAAFIEHFESEMKRLGSDVQVAKIWEIRNLSVHRRYLPVAEINLGRLLRIPKKRYLFEDITDQAKRKYYVDIETLIELITACTHALEELEGFVSTTHRKFPLRKKKG